MHTSQIWVVVLTKACVLSYSWARRWWYQWVWCHGLWLRLRTWSGLASDNTHTHAHKHTHTHTRQQIAHTCRTGRENSGSVYMLIWSWTAPERSSWAFSWICFVRITSALIYSWGVFISNRFVTVFHGEQRTLKDKAFELVLFITHTKICAGVSLGDDSPTLQTPFAEWSYSQSNKRGFFWT